MKTAIVTQEEFVSGKAFEMFEASDEKTCRNCKFSGKFTQIGLSAWWDKDDTPLYAYCENARYSQDVGADESPMMLYGDSEGYSAHFYVREDFSCVLFESNAT